MATVQEEIGGVGAATATFALKPDLALVIDLTHATDTPGVDQKQEGERGFGSGPELAVGSYVHRGILDLLIATAVEQSIPYTLAASPSRTGTDADQVAGALAGVPTAVVSVPCRYMHSPSEMVDLEDVDAAGRLLVAAIRRLDGDYILDPAKSS